MTMSIRKGFIAVALSSLAAVSCGFLDQDARVIVSSTFYNSVEEAQYGLNAIYGVLNSGEIYGNYYSMAFSAIDDLFYMQGVSSNGEDSYTHDASNPRLYEMWWRFYQGINNANNFLSAMEDHSDLDPDGQMIAQARFLRAYLQFLVAQLWGDVPLMDKAVDNYTQTNVAATPQYDVLLWCESEMKQAIADYKADVEGAPSKLSRDAMKGILARMYLWMAGATVECDDNAKAEYVRQADSLCADIINSGRHTLNPSYRDFFIRLISNVYDTDYRESMWEVDFYGDRKAKGYTNGEVGSRNGLRSIGDSNYEAYNCNTAYGMYSSTLGLWIRYMQTDRTPNETGLSYVTDDRQEWNVPPYSYVGRSASDSPLLYPYGGDPTDLRELKGGVDKTPYYLNRESTADNPLANPAGRWCGKFRRECIYEGNTGSRESRTAINFPILRYSDVLLMYAETQNEVNGAPTEAGYEAIKQVRDRALIATNEFGTYNYDTFKQFVRDERARELCMEATRKYDLIRWGIFQSSMRAESYNTSLESQWGSYQSSYFSRIAGNIQARHVVLPIPAIELGVNKLLVQNPLW